MSIILKYLKDVAISAYLTILQFLLIVYVSFISNDIFVDIQQSHPMVLIYSWLFLCSVITRVGALVNDLDGEILNEIIRLGAYGFMGPEHGLGGVLILPDGTTPADKEDLFGKETDIFRLSF